MTDQNQKMNTGVNNGRPNPTNVKSKSTRPFAMAVEQYKRYLDKAVLKAIAQLSKETDTTRYARVIVKFFDVIEVDVELTNGEIKTYTYPIHKLHYGPINKNIVNYIPFPAGTPLDLIRATKFCYRDPSIWVEVNGEGKNPGGDGTGFGDTACSPFRDTQVRLRDQGYFLVDLSEYILDEDAEVYDEDGNKIGKWYFKIDIRLYQDPKAVEANPNLWHQYGVIPGMGKLLATAGAATDSATDPVSVAGANESDPTPDHGDLNVEKTVPAGDE